MIDTSTNDLDHDEKMLSGAGVENPPTKISDPVVTEHEEAYAATDLSEVD